MKNLLTKNKNNFKFTITVTLLSTIGALFVLLNTSLPSEALEQMPKATLITLSLLQVGVLIFALSFIGFKIAKSLNLNVGILGHLFNNDKKSSYKINKTSLLLSILFGFITAFIMIAFDKFIFGNFIPQVANTTHEFSLQFLLSGIFYGGVAEEIICRLFLVSLIVFILSKIFLRKKSNKEIPASFYYIAIIVAAILFGLGHLPATLMTFDFSFAVIARMILLNGVGALFYGYLYYKKGFEYGVIAHSFTHIFMQLIFLPLLF